MGFYPQLILSNISDQFQNAVLNIAFSLSSRKSKCCTEPLFTVIEDQTSSVSFPFLDKTCFRIGFLTLKDPDKVF